MDAINRYLYLDAAKNQAAGIQFQGALVGPTYTPEDLLRAVKTLNDATAALRRQGWAVRFDLEKLPEDMPVSSNMTDLLHVSLSRSTAAHL